MGSTTRGRAHHLRARGDADGAVYAARARVVQWQREGAQIADEPGVTAAVAEYAMSNRRAKREGPVRRRAARAQLARVVAAGLRRIELHRSLCRALGDDAWLSSVLEARDEVRHRSGPRVSSRACAAMSRRAATPSTIRPSTV